MKLRVLGCHGGTSLAHRNVSFLLDERVALDAGSVASALSVEEQRRVQLVLVTHSHLDHICDLGTLVDLRAQQGGERLTVAGLDSTIDALRAHFFNGVLWPDFTHIPSSAAPCLELVQLDAELTHRRNGFAIRAIPVDHSVPSCGFLLECGGTTLAYSGDTGPTQRFWEVLEGVGNLAALITEVSYPNARAELAAVSGHLTPNALVEELTKWSGGSTKPVLIYGMKPLFVDEIRRELAALELPNVTLLEGGEVFDYSLPGSGR